MYDVMMMFNGLGVIWLLLICVVGLPVVSISVAAKCSSNPEMPSYLAAGYVLLIAGGAIGLCLYYIISLLFIY